MQGVTVELGGARREIRFTINSIIDLEERFGVGFYEFSDKVPTTMRNIRTLLWAGLKHADPDLTEVEVGALMDGASLADIVSAIGEAQMVSADPAAREKKSDENKASGADPDLSESANRELLGESSRAAKPAGV